MKFSLKLTALVLLLLPPCKDICAQGWQGLVPGRSTRSDVVRLLNKCAAPEEACDFKLGTERTYILFSGSLPKAFSACALSLPRDTVMFIEVRSSTERKLGDLRLDKKNLKAFSPTVPYNGEDKAYFDANKGVIVQTYRNWVTTVHYVANHEDKLFCPGYYNSPLLFVEKYRAHMPTAYVSCSAYKIVAGEPIVASAFATLDTPRGFTWKVNFGKILAGQSSDTLTVDTTGLAGQILVVTAEITGSLNHTVTASCAIEIIAPARAPL